jgi:hypothetical protein
MNKLIAETKRQRQPVHLPCIRHVRARAASLHLDAELRPGDLLQTLMPEYWYLTK